MGIENEKSLVPTAEEVRNLVQKAYDAGCTRGREEMLALQGLDAAEAGVYGSRLWRHLTELMGAVRLDADVTGDEQRVEMIDDQRIEMMKELLTRWHKIATIIIREAIVSHCQTRN